MKIDYEGSDNERTSVDPESLCQAIVRLEEVDLNASDEVINSLLHKIENTDHLKLKKLRFGVFESLTVPSEILSNAILRLEEMDLEFVVMETHQINAIFEEIIAGREMKLRKLTIKEKSCVKVKPETLLRVKEKIRLCYSNSENWERDWDNIFE